MNAVEWGRANARRQTKCARRLLARPKRMVQYRIADPGPGFKFEELKHARDQQTRDEDPLQHTVVREQQGMRPGGLGYRPSSEAWRDELLYNERQKRRWYS